MTTAVLILLARAIHVLAGIAWAGAVFMMTSVVLPIAAKHGAEGAGRWVGMIGRKVGPASAIAALLTILSGIYLMIALHPNDTSLNARVLQAGAVAAVLSFIVGFFIGRPAGLKLAQLNEQNAQAGAPSAEVAGAMATLRTRAAVSSGLTAALLALSILAMAVFRYVQILA